MTRERIGIHVQLQPHAWRQLRARAELGQLTVDDYLERILDYSRDSWGAAADRATGTEERLYVPAAIARELRERLAAQAARATASLASVAGRVIEEFLARHERDPADLELIHRLHRQLEETSILAESQVLSWVQAALRLHSIERMPAAFQARWIYSRLQPHLPAVRRAQETVGLTLPLVSELIERARTSERG